MPYKISDLVSGVSPTQIFADVWESETITEAMNLSALIQEAYPEISSRIYGAVWAWRRAVAGGSVAMKDIDASVGDIFREGGYVVPKKRDFD